MAVASIHMLLVSVRLKDIPVGHDPPVGPSARFRATYNQRDAYQPQTFSYSHLGPKWTFDWLSFIEDNPSNPAADVTVYHRNGGKETSTAYNATTQTYAPTIRRQTVIKRVSTSPIVYERRLPDGSVEVFGQPNGASTPRKVFLTAIKDQSGNTLSFTWDAQFRLVAATDAIGQVTTISYEDADPLRITKVTDPYGRFARFEYDTAGRLERITDVIGITSAFTYGFGDVVKTLTTPYGRTTITTGEAGLSRWAEITDPMGGKERVQYGYGLVNSEPTSAVPSGMPTNNINLNDHNTLYWDKQAMLADPLDTSSATDYVWALVQSGAYQTAAVPLSIKKPLENRVWYAYQGGGSTREGTVRKPVAIGRVLDDGTSQLTKYEYNALGNVTKRVDPLGRETIYEYDTTGRDVLRTKQKNGNAYDLVSEVTYTAEGLPLVVTDMAGQSTTYTYDARGRVETITNAGDETTTYTYTNDRLTSVTGALPSAVHSFTYDGYGRVRTTTDSDGATITTDYDVFDRPTRVTYPDSTYEETSYRHLHVETRRDRLGRLTRYTYDGARRLTSTRDPAGRLVTQEWCACGSLEALVDAHGNRTRWERDVQGRVTREVRADGTTATVYTYQPKSGRLATVTDPKQQITTYGYATDDQRLSTTFSNATIATPAVTLSYDPIYGRLVTMTDGTGVTSYTYHAAGLPGAGQVASVDGPLTADTTTYTYDELGRVESRAINGGANTVSWAFDALGRVETEANVLGTFTYSYDGATTRVASVIYPNGQRTLYSYFGNAGDHRLKTIHHQYPNGTTLSKFEYTYDGIGNILTWRQQADAAAVLWEYGYDPADQLVAAIKKSTDPTPSILQRYAYTYDPAGNRTSEQIDDQVTGASYDVLNRLVSQQGAGMLQFAGTVDEPATVTIHNTPATVTVANAFSASVPVAAGTNTFTVTATDSSGNSASHFYEVTNQGSNKTFVYDANGNLTSDGTRIFEWDARNQLVAINFGDHRTEFVYDGRQRRATILEKDNGGVIQSGVDVLWCDGLVCEERSRFGGPPHRLFALGEQLAAESRYFALDHLRSIRAVVLSGDVIDTYAYDPWGRRSELSSAQTYGFTGYRSAVTYWISPTRTYDPDTARWISQDPSGYVDGTNLFRYTRNNPIRYTDPDGLTTQLCCRPLANGVGVVTGQRHCFVVITQNRNISGGAATGYSLDGSGATHKNWDPDMRQYFNGAECRDVPCDSCAEEKIDKEWSDPGPSGNYKALGPNSNTYARGLLERSGCTPPRFVRDAPGYNWGR